MMITLADLFKKKTRGKETHNPQKASDLPTGEYLDDITFVEDMKHLTVGSWHQYDVLLAARPYDWGTMIHLADYMAASDLEDVSQVTTGSMGIQEKDITESYHNSNGKCAETRELKTEMGNLSIAGLSKTLKAPMKIVLFNQTRVFRFFTSVDNELLIKRYAETVARRTFGTDKAMRLGKPVPNGQ